MNEEILDEVRRIYDYLPSEEMDRELYEYVSKVYNTVENNLEKEEYQVVYFNIHLMFMTYIYNIVWQIFKLIPERYSDAVIYMRAYNGKKVDLLEIEKVFEYSEIPDKDILKILKLIGMDGGQVTSINELFSIRDLMAHATGKILVENIIVLQDYLKQYIKYIETVHEKMKPLISKWYEDNIIMKYYKEIEYGDILNLLSSEINLSIEQIKQCESFGISKYSNTRKYSFTKEEIINIKKIRKYITEAKLILYEI